LASGLLEIQATPYDTTPRTATPSRPAPEPAKIPAERGGDTVSIEIESASTKNGVSTNLAGEGANSLSGDGLAGGIRLDKARSEEKTPAKTSAQALLEEIKEFKKKKVTGVITRPDLTEGPKDEASPAESEADKSRGSSEAGKGSEVGSEKVTPRMERKNKLETILQKLAESKPQEKTPFRPPAEKAADRLQEKNAEAAGPEGNAEPVSRDKGEGSREKIEDLTEPCLIVQSGKFKGKKFILLPEGITVGRHSGNIVAIPDMEMSKVHARIFQDKNKFYLEDMKSTNGTFLNANRITNRSELKNLDKVSIGVTRFSVFIPQSPSENPKT
jgi:hypothetical protein